MMARTGMVENIQTAIKFVEQGHVRVGTDVSDLVLAFSPVSFLSLVVFFHVEPH